jgi:hypothetical protein
MNTRAILFAVFLSWAAAAASAQTVADVAFTPPALDSHSALTAVISGNTSCLLNVGKAVVSGATITITVTRPPLLPCGPFSLPWSGSLFIGTLAPGRYDVVTVSNGQTLDRRSIVIADADAPIRVEENAGPTVGFQGVSILPVNVLFCCGQPEVTFDDVQASVSSATVDRIAVTPPPHAAGAATVKVAFPGGLTYTAIGGFRYVDLQGPVDRAAYETILIPLVFAGKGAFGSDWTTDLWAYNSSGHSITQLNGPFQLYVCIVGPCLQAIESHATVRYRDAATVPYAHGRLMYVPRAGGPGLQFGLRIRDLTKQADALGTEIPVVRESDLRAGAFSLLDIPADGRFRSKLRIYSIGGTAQSVDVRISTMDTNANVAPVTFSLNLSARTDVLPAYAETDLELILSTLGQPPPYRVEVSPRSPNGIPSYWGFITVTNNQTQHVTVVTPH